MFEFVRKHTRILQLFLLLLILPSFVVFGIQGYSKFADTTGLVAKVGQQKIMQAQWDNAHRNLVERLRQQQPTADVHDFDAPQYRRQSLDYLVRQALLTEAARDQHVVITDARLMKEFATDPRFSALFNPDGSFNKALLEARGMSAEQLVALVRDEMMMGQVLAGVQLTALTSSQADERAMDALFQVRDVQWVKFDPKQYASGLTPTDAQLHQVYADPANVSWLRSPERADVQYVVLDVDALKPRVSVNEDELHRNYQENLKRFTLAEERRASHILIKVDAKASAQDKQAAKAKAQALLAQVRKNPAAFAELARKNSDDPGSAANGGDLDFFGRGAMTPAFEEAAFKLKKGEISDVVETPFGYHIILLTDVRGGQVQPYEAVRAQIEDEARTQLAQRQFAEVADRFTNMVFEQPDSLKPAADAFKLTIHSQAAVLRNPGKTDQGVFSNKHLLDALFDATNRAKSRNTDAIEVAPSRLVSARIVSYQPSVLRPFDSVRDELKAHWVEQAARAAAHDDAAKKLAAWKADPKLAAAALPAPVHMSRRTVFAQPPAVLDAAMRVAPEQLKGLVLVDLGKDGSAILRVNAILPMDLTKDEVKETQTQFGELWGQAEGDAYLEALKRHYKVEYLNDGKKVMDPSADSQKTTPAS